MKYVNENFAKFMNEVPEYKKDLDQMRADVDTFMENFHDDPKNQSSWGHNYFCDIDGGRIIFDINNPKKHTCSVCGKSFESKLFDQVWTYFYRNTAIVNMLASAAVYEATKEQKYLDYAKMIIAFYADHYLEFTLHDNRENTFESVETQGWGASRIMPQGLNESIILIRVCQTYEIIKEYIDEDFKAKIFGWFQEVYKMLKPQTDKIHNIRCWYDCIIGSMGLICGDAEMVDFAFNGEFGLHNQFKDGVTDDGFWFEGSIHYNMFLLEGATYLLLFAKLYGYDFGDKTENTMKKMLKSFYYYAFDNDVLPNPNDAWPRLNLKTYSFQYDIMSRIYGEDSEIANMMKNFEANDCERGTVPLSEPMYINNKHSIERLLFNIDFDFDNYVPLKRVSTHYAATNYAMLRNENINVFFKYGLLAPSHSHPDLMAIEFTYKGDVISRDISNAGYSARLCNEWHRKTIAHSTVCCNGVDITSVSQGECVEFSENHVKATKPDVYRNIGYTRDLTIDDNAIYDIFNVDSEKENNCDYVIHYEKEYKATANLEEGDAELGFMGEQEVDPDIVIADGKCGFEKSGYQHILGAKKVIAQDGKCVVTLTDGKTTIEHVIESEGKEVFLLQTMDNPVSDTRASVLVREIGKHVEFRSVINFK